MPNAYVKTRYRISRRQTGAALLAAMLTVTLVATFAAAALWQQWRSVEIETAERARVQAAWILTGALDWLGLILRVDGRAGGADHLGEVWAVPLNEARLSSFLAVDKNASETEREAFLSGHVIDLQSRLNVTNLAGGGSSSKAAMNAFALLFIQLGLPQDQLIMLQTSLIGAAPTPLPVGSDAASNSNAAPATTAAATPATAAASAPAAQVAPVTPVAPNAPIANALGLLMPERVDQLAWLGLPQETLTALGPYITLLPTPTKVNLNTASAEVIAASTPGMGMADAQRAVTLRDRQHFASVADANSRMGWAKPLFLDAEHDVSSQFFEVTGQLRLEQTVVQERSVLQRTFTGQQATINILSRDRGVVISPPSGRP
jgi:general secretion pathway protein K